MSLSPAELWDRLRQRARQVLPEQTYRTWLEPTEALAVEGDTLMIGSPDQFSADWNESKHADLLTGFAPVALGHPLALSSTRTGRTSDGCSSKRQRPLLRITQQHSRISTPLNPRYTFDQFVIGKSNDVAAAAAQAAAQAPGKVYNPLFIYGDTGLGKTHLMQGIAHELMRRTPALRLAVHRAVHQRVRGAIQTGQMGHSPTVPRNRSPPRRRRPVPEGQEGTQEELAFNALYEAGRQVVLTSDRPPKEIPGLESRLVSRFEWGMVANIDSPDLEHRIAILRKKASLDHLELTIPDEVIEFIAST
jgi:chromosomal replication initiator protein